MSVTAKTANGWGSVHNGGITGGTGGIEISFDSFPEMWVWMNANKTTSAILTYTGPNFDRTGFSAITANSTFTNTSRFQILGLKNKTIRASQGQRLTFVTVRFREVAENIIWENWEMFDAVVGQDLLSIGADSVNIWIRHCTLNANSFDSQDGTVDGTIDIANRANYIAVTDCTLINSNKTCLIADSNVSITDRGFLKVTYTRNKFINCIQRKPLCRFGPIGFHFNTVNDSELVSKYTTSRVIQVAAESRVFSYRNNYQAGRWLFMDRFGIDSDINSSNWGALKSVEDVVGPSWILGLVQVRPELVTWDPRTEENYTLEDWTAAEAEEWVDTWAGATMHLMGQEETPSWSLTIASNNTNFGTVATVSVNPIVQGSSVTVTATPLTGYKFDLWQDTSDGSTVSESSTYTFNMPSNNLNLIGLFSSIVSPPPQPRKKIRMLKRLIILLISIIL